MRRKRDFERAFRGGSRARGSILLVIVVPNELAVTRLGLSVGKGVWRRAVQRNRVRRIFREAFRLEQHALPSGVDIVLVPAVKGLWPELGATRAELVQLARKALRRYREKLASAAPRDASAAPTGGENAP